MAGIGFTLRRLTKRVDLTGIVQAYWHAAIASTGPWLFTVIALGTFYFIFKNFNFTEDQENFRAVILYNFAFSLILVAPFSIVTTRHLADSIYQKRFEDTIGIMIGTFITIFTVGMPISIAFYFLYAQMTFSEAVMSVINFVALLAIWHLTIFISAIKYYQAVTLSFIIGLIIAVIATIILGMYFSIAGMLAGFTIGLGCIIASLMALVLTEYPKEVKNMFKNFHYLKTYWMLALSTLFYNLAIWVDKWVMWFSPESVRLSNNLVICPLYDEAIFLAYLTLIPGLAMFLLNQETAFYEVYHQFYQDILKHASLKKIQSNHQKLWDSLMQSGRQLVLVQISVCLIVILLAPQIFELMGINLIKIGIFRLGVLGATFHIFTLYIIITLSYFDDRKGNFWIQFVFFISNLFLTILFLKLGFPFYGLGYFLSALVTFALAATIFESYVWNLPYHAFITSNPSVKPYQDLI